MRTQLHSIYYNIKFLTRKYEIAIDFSPQIYSACIFRIPGEKFNVFRTYFVFPSKKFKGKWQQKFPLSHLKETLKVIYRSLLQNFYICFTLGDIVT